MVFPEAKGLTFNSKDLNIPISTPRTHYFHLLQHCNQDRTYWPHLFPFVSLSLNKFDVQMPFNMSDYTPSRLSAALVRLSVVVFTLVPGIYGAVLYVKALQTLAGVNPNEPLSPLSPESWFIAIFMVASMSLGSVLGGIVWTILLNIILPSNAARYWARYPSPYVPILTPLFEKLNDWVLNIRSRKQK